MPLRRPSSSILQRRIEELGRQKAYRDELRVLAEGQQSAFWAALQKRMESKLGSIEFQLDNYLTLPEREVAALLEQRKVVRLLEDMVSGTGHTLEGVERRVAELEEEINERREQFRDN